MAQAWLTKEYTSTEGAKKGPSEGHSFIRSSLAVCSAVHILTFVRGRGDRCPCLSCPPCAGRMSISRIRHVVTLASPLCGVLFTFVLVHTKKINTFSPHPRSLLTWDQCSSGAEGLGDATQKGPKKTKTRSPRSVSDEYYFLELG